MSGIVDFPNETTIQRHGKDSQSIAGFTAAAADPRLLSLEQF
jgi:hypothetical protein